MVKIETVGSPANTSVASSSRISAHTHISGLGLDENGDAIVPIAEDGQSSINTSGLVGQVAAREALGIVSDLIHSQRLAGRALLLVGPPGRLTNETDPNTNGCFCIFAVTHESCVLNSRYFFNHSFPFNTVIRIDADPINICNIGFQGLARYVFDWSASLTFQQ